MKKLFLVLACVSLFLVLNSQDLETDINFGNNGIVKVLTPNSYSVGYKVVPLNDGSYISANLIENVTTGESGFSLVKLLSDGNIDSSFGMNGHFNIVTDHTEYPADFVILPDKKIAIAISDNDGKIELNIINENGSQFKKFNLSPFPNNYLIPIRILFRDNHLYIGGIYNSQNLDLELMFVIKIDLDGNFDKTFAENGVFMSEKIIELNAKFRDMAFQNDDIIIFSSGNSDDLSDYLFMFRINQNGGGDLSFSEGGILFIKNEASENFGTIKTDMSGSIYMTLFDYPEILKINSDGFPDPGYGIKGHAIDNYYLDNLKNSFFSILLKDNSALIFGTALKGSSDQYDAPAIAKYDKEGKRDIAFGNKGIFAVPADFNATFINGCIDNDNNLVAIGTCEGTSGNLNSQTFLTRYNIKTATTNDDIQTEQILLYPNPVDTDYFYINCANKKNITSSYSIFDNLGRKVLTGQFQKEHLENDKIDLPDNLRNGLYFLYLQSDPNSKMIKFVVKH